MTSSGRIRFEIRVLGVATAETLHFDDVAVRGEPLPKVGDTAGPLRSMAAWRRVIAVEPAPKPWNVAAVVRLEDIDCTTGERDSEVEMAALRNAGWKG